MAFPLFGQRFKSLIKIRVPWVFSAMVLIFFFFLLYIGFSIRTQNQIQIQTQIQIQNQTNEAGQKSADVSNSIPKPGNYSYPKPRHAIQGFTYDGVVQGQKRIKITADSFVIKKKKMGFLRFGLIQEAVFINAKIHLYGIDLIDKDEKGILDKGNADYGKGGNSMADPSFAGVFFSDELMFIPEKVSGLRMTPVKFYLHDDQSRVVGFSAAKGEISLGKKTILLTGHARVQFQNRQINAGRISLGVDQPFVVAEQDVMYSSGSVPWKGDQLTTDLYLNRIETKQGP